MQLARGLKIHIRVPHFLGASRLTGKEASATQDSHERKFLQVLQVLPRTDNRTSRISKPVGWGRSLVHPQNRGNFWPATATTGVHVEPKRIPPGNRR
jgi:hypothetical protein